MRPRFKHNLLFVSFLLIAICAVGNVALAEVQKTDESLSLEVASKISSKSIRNYAFNDLSVQTKDGNVILTGKVRDAYLSDLAEKAAKEVTGVRSVENRITILPVSISDERLRIALFRRFRNDDRLAGYLVGRPSMSIIVEHSRVTLTGVVATNVDRAVAGSLARQMFGVLSVDNQLRVD